MRVAQDLPEEMVRRALACYYGLVTMTDQNVGRMLEAIDNSALRENTVVIYTTDHGDSGGHHGLWQKNCFYEPSVRVPLIIRAPGGARGTRVQSCSSLVDIAPTLYEMAGVSLPDKLSGESLVGLLHGSENGQRVAFSEYHSNGMLNAGYMIRKGKYKYNYYVDHEPQLFDLVEDPDEINDLGQDPQYQAIRDELCMELLEIVDPEQVDKEAKENQSRKAEDRASWFSWLSFTDLIDRPLVDGGSSDRSIELVD
jgi:choline-sulfatase